MKALIKLITFNMIALFLYPQNTIAQQENVWPGDTNLDGIVTVSDFISIVEYDSEVGSNRTINNQNIDWYGHLSPEWDTRNAAGVDISHFDCNGDGVINQVDKQAVLLNLSYEHPEEWIGRPSNLESENFENTGNQMRLMEIGPSTINSVRIGIELLTTSNNGYTIKNGYFTILVNAVILDAFVNLDSSESWLDNVEILYNISPNANNELQVAFAHTNGTTSSGIGYIGYIDFELNNNAQKFGNKTFQNTFNFATKKMQLIHDSIIVIPIENTSVSVTVDNINDQEVYPGDLNNDGIVNNQDISLSGFFHSATDVARTTEHQNINWYAHPSEDWGVLNNQGIDLKHHDCNGDGVIDENDQQAIYENMDSIWKIPDPLPPPPTQSDYQVMLHPIDQIYDGYLVMNVALERRTSGDLTLQGGHFTIDYSDVEGEFSFVELDFLPITWLGVPSQNLWFETTHFPEDKKIEVGFTKNNDSNSTGSGVIAQLILQYSSLARQARVSDITYQFTVNTIGVHNNNGDFTPIEDQLLQVNLNSQCEPNWTIDEDTPFQNEYKSSSNITTNGFVLIGEDQEVEYKANRVQINTGFSAKAGADFKVRSSGCN